MTKLRSVLKEKFGYDGFRPGQEEAVRSILNEEHSLVMLATGSGKSLCYQLPAYFLDGLVIVVSPLLALMQDQVSSLKMRGEKRVVALTSALTARQKSRIIRQLDQVKFLFLSPEMLQNKNLLAKLQTQRIALFVVDEAHCISQWGIDFRPDYLILGQVRQSLNNPLTLALTATATPQVQEDIIKGLGLNDEPVTRLIHSVNRPNIKFQVQHCQANKDQELLEIVKDLAGPGIVYFSSKKECERLASFLAKESKLNVAYYHGDLAIDDRSKIQAQFNQDQLDLICATNAFGMGIDKANIRYVIHYHMPANIEAYVQEFGRAGRDNKDALSIILYQSGDEKLQTFLNDISLPDENRIKAVYSQQISLDRGQDEDLQLIHFYQKQGISQDDLIKLFQDRRWHKEKELNQMLALVESETCRRQMILQHFEEHMLEKPAVCCDLCQGSLVNQFKNQNKSGKKRDIKTRPWREILEGIF